LTTCLNLPPNLLTFLIWIFFTWYKDLASTDQAYASSCESISFKFTNFCEIKIKLPTKFK
jgi:hypothetical protein